MMDNHNKVKKSYYVLAWAIFLIGLVVGLVGMFLELYNEFVFFDEVIHAFTSLGLAMVLSLHLFARSLMGAWRHVVTFVLTATLMTIGIGALWEVFEWGYDQWMTAGNTTLGKTDTVFDLILDAGGGFVGAIFGALMVRASVPEHHVVEGRPVGELETPATA